MNNTILHVAEFIYYVSFIILTLAILIYTIKSYYNQKKQPTRLIARINYQFKAEAILVILDILNSGDYVSEKVHIKLALNHDNPHELDCIDFIAPKENFSFVLGDLDDKILTLFTGKKISLPDPYYYDYFSLTTHNNDIILKIIGHAP